MVKRWEFALIERDNVKDATESADEFGAEGWELVSHSTHKVGEDTTWCLSFRRALPEARWEGGDNG